MRTPHIGHRGHAVLERHAIPLIRSRVGRLKCSGPMNQSAAHAQSLPIAEVRDYLGQLPPPREGLVRVYRGQGAHYGSILPTRLRAAPVPSDRILRQYSMFAADVLRESSGASAGASSLWMSWTHAISQHYGPGTPYLDATTSIETAIWFALNRPEYVDVKEVRGRPGPIDPRTDHIVETRWLRFVPRDEGVIYVFDVRPWPNNGLIEHGMLVDLATAPTVFASSTRMRNQSGCLIKADPAQAGGELSSFLVCEPIRIRRSPGDLVGPGADVLFPPPMLDPWYDRFLSLPWVPTADPGANRLRLVSPVPVTIYLPESRDQLQEVAQRQILLDPILLWPYLYKESLKADTWLPPQFKPPGDAVHITLEMPAYALTPPLDGPWWNLEVLFTDLPERASVQDCAGMLLGDAALDKVIFEFSPLELVAWDAAETIGSNREFLRAIYFERTGTRLEVFSAIQEVPQGKIRVAGPLTYEYDSAKRSLDGPPEFPWTRKGLIACLTVLRELAEAPILSPFPKFMGLGVADYEVRLQGRAHLMRVPLAGDGYTHFIRGNDHNEPFGAQMNNGSVVVPAQKPWNDVEPGAFDGATSGS